MNARIPALSLAGILTFTGALAAQTQAVPGSMPALGIDFLVADPRGDFSRFVSSGYGGDFSGRIPLEPTGVVSLRANLGILVYGHESRRVCFEGVSCRVGGRLQTFNNILFGGIGPEVALPMERVRPYVNAFLGFGYFNTTSTLETLWGDEDLMTTENLGDGTFSWGFGGGIEVSLNRGRTPLALNLGASYHQNGMAEYLTEGDIVDNPDGSVTLFPVFSETNLVSFRIGISIGIPRGGDGEEEGKVGRSHW